jgi:hypothetical protein
MSKIMDNLRKVHAAVAIDNALGSGKLGEDIGRLAVAAITGGIKSPAWRTYMTLFADNPAQLERLTVDPPPAGEKDYLPQLRAYVVSNAVCAADTGTFVADRVDDRINGTVSEAVDTEFVAARAIPIPDIQALLGGE